MRLAPLYPLLAAVALSICGTAAGQSGVPARLSFEARQAVLRVAGGDTLSLEGQQYLSRLAAFERRQRSVRPEAKPAAEVHEFLGGQVESLGPIVFFTRHPLTRPNAAGCTIWQSVPERWGCSIRIYDPARADAPAKSIFRDPEGSIFDMSLSQDGTTLFFSYKKRNDRCWQIYEIGIDGRGLKSISRDPTHYDVSPVELPDGDLLFVSTRRGGFLLSETGPRSNLHVMKRDGSHVRCVSQNTLSDFSPHLLPDGRVLFTRWEYVDRDVEYRLGLWTQRPDGRHFQHFFGNAIREVGMFWQARPVPGHDNLLVATFAPPNGWPHGAIGLVQNRLGPDARRDRGFVWITEELSNVGDSSIHADGMSYQDMDDGRLLDLARDDDEFRGNREQIDLSVAHEFEARADKWFDSSRWQYRDPFPVNDYLFLVSYGGGGESGRFALYLLDLCGNRVPVYATPQMGCYSPLLLQPRNVPSVPLISGRTLKHSASDGSWATLLVTDVYRGMSSVRRGQARYIQIMEQVPKTREWSRRAYDQSPVIGYGTFYTKRCWGRVPIEPDGSAHFDVPALREVYLQVLDAEGRELQRQTSSIQLMPNEVRSCIGCHEPRNSAPPRAHVPLAARRPATRPVPPRWTADGMIDFVTVVEPVLEKYCVVCHSGPNPKGGCDLSGDKTRLFNMAYDNLLGRSASYRQHNLTTGRMLSQEAARGRPLVHFYWLRRSPTAVNRPLWSGSYVSRLVDYLDAGHCGQDVLVQDRQRIAIWIDANVPYYGTYDASRPLSPGGRDLCTDTDTGREATWFADRFLEVYNRRCARCHGKFPHPNDHENIWNGRFAWINFTHPEWSPALSAHLSKKAGGRGLPTERFDGETPLFTDKSDADYVTMLEAIREGRRQMLARPRVDMDPK